ncbi:hypothetical protein PPL_11643 [Heterostelium album PN500]|uniref:Uncharacterized protein n=1 Tax=Heterostelium pallidum (strain ATCC 26659 / Pp 5 / PN500) TaxID=670386 RepID=D3BVB7_HETP5|nr:hypothetical protein PPL_11643 [Heterostelium album PN500]EFA74674.1 hypothetical protein PPL_11643 [Heterostelium album PN500]|eukprot:XP_020426808.1 hypothetical protein PPL_11643 [Heterostelium album PN500]
MNTSTYSIEKTDRLINGKNVLKFSSATFYLIVLVHNHLKDKDNEQHTNIILIGNIKNNDEIVVPDTVDTQYQLIIICSKSLLNLSILLNKSESYTINLPIISQFKHKFDYYKQRHIIKNKRYHSISRFTNSNNINDINYKDNQKSYERAENEIKAMKLLKGNQRFVQLFDYHHDKDNQIFHIITQYCYGGDLSQKYKHLADLNLYEYITMNHFYIEHKNRIFKESDIFKYISELFNILLDLDKHGIVHCDIKPSNIFIGEGGSLILGDFGCCKFIDQSTIIEHQDTNVFFKPSVVITSVSNSKEITDPTISDIHSNTLINATRGTIGYISPEAMNRQYAQSCDIFSIGSTILKLLCCHQDDRNNHQLFQSTGEIKISEFRYSKQLIDLIHQLLDQSPKNRESLNQLLNQYIETNTNQHSITFNLNTTFKNRSVNITEIKFGDEFNQPLQSNSLPPNLTSLSFGSKFNQILSVVGVLPKSLKSLSFGNEFNQILSVGALPKSRKSLVFGYLFNQILSVGVLPESLESLTFGDKFNQIISVGVLPKSLKSLKFGVKFNQILSVGVLPESLESLEFGWEFNQILSVGVLPESLKSLSFGRKFNQILSVGVLPKSLKSLEFGNEFNQILSVGVLPESLKSLKFGNEFNQILSVGALPKSRKSLVFGYLFHQILSVGVLPESLESLEFGDKFNQILSVVPHLCKKEQVLRGCFTTVKGHRVHIPMDFIFADVDPKVCIIGVDSLAKLDFRIVDNTLTISNNIVKTFRRGATNHSALRNNIDFHVSGRKRKSTLKCLFASTQKCDILHEITKICHQIHVTKEKLKTDFENFHFGNFNKFGYSPMTMATLNPNNPTNSGIEHINTADIADSYLVWIDPDDVKTTLPTATTFTTNVTAASEDGLDGVREDIINMLKSDFQDVVSPMTSPPPFREDVDMKINLNAPVQKQRMFPVPQSLLEELHNQIKDLLHKGFIVPSNAEYGAPVLFVKKKTGNWRMCVDYRQLNKSTVKNSYPLPRINELLDRTKAAHWLSKLDLLHGYHQLRKNLQDADKTTFRCPFGSFKYTVIPFGLSNAPAVFQSFMDSVFKLEVFQKLLLVYLDDLLIMTNNSSITEHIDGIKHVFTILRKNNLHVNLSKCTFLVRSVDYLGHMVGNGKIDPLQDKIDSIIAWKEPNNKDELRSFLGLVNYYNRFIPRLATVQAPLTFLLRKFAPFHWSDDCQLAFDTIKSAIKEKPSLFPPNYDLPFIFECDASDVGTGYRLFQLVDGKENVICYGSKKLKDSETRYSTLEKELLAIVTALKANYYHIFGRDIEIRTDHKNITYINEANKIGINQTINRWIAHINLYQPKIKFIKGKDNTIADGLSRYTFNVSVSLSHPTIANDIIDGYRIEDNSNLSNGITDYTTINGLRYTHDVKCFQRINIDFIPNLPVEEYMGRKVDAIMVVVDALSKMTILIPLGSDYTSKDQLTKAYGIHHSTSAVSNQQANGQAERIIRAVKNATRKLMVDDRLHNTTGSWSKHIDTVEFSLNSTVHSTTEYTPFKIYLGHNPLTPLNLVKESDALVDVTDKQIIESIKERKAIIKLVKRNICIGNQEMRFTWNKDVIGKDGISTKKKKFNSKHIMLYDPKMNDNLINDVDDLLVENGATAETDRGSTVGDSSDDYDDSPRPIRRHTRRGLKNVERSVDKDDMEDNELNDDDDSDYDNNEDDNNNNNYNNNNNDDMDMNDDDSDNLLINNNNNNSNNSNNNNNNNNNNNLNIDYLKFISNDSKFHQNITTHDVKVLAYTKWRKDIVAILAKRKFTLGISKLARVEYLVKVGRALAWVPLPGNTLATKFSSAHSVPDPTDG